MPNNTPLMAQPPVELRDWAIAILSAETLEQKLFTPAVLIDTTNEPPLFWKEPVRPQGMGFQKRGRQEKLPHFEILHKTENVAMCLHRFAGHELLAVELMAYALLAFPEAPKHFRKGIAHILKEEQGHVILYRQRMEELGIHFGDLPLYRHFWIHTPYFTSPLHFVSAMNLTFEMANLDFAPYYKHCFEFHGDHSSAKLMQQIFDDEIGHVSFGWRWLKKFKPLQDSEWDAWRAHLSPLLNPKRARGFTLSEENRRRAGISQEWIEQLKRS